MEDIFSRFGDVWADSGLSDIFEHLGFNFGGGGSSRSKRVRRGSDLRVKVRLTLEEIATGTEKKIKVKKLIPCEHCHGTGSEDGNTETCPTCHGTGRIVKTQRGIFGMMQVQEVCPTCGGEGKVIKNKCPHCNGEGVVREDVGPHVAVVAGRVAAGEDVGEGVEEALPRERRQLRFALADLDLHERVPCAEMPDAEAAWAAASARFALLPPLPG